MTHRTEPTPHRITRRVIGLLASAAITFGLLYQVTSMAHVDPDEATPGPIAAATAAASPN